MNVKANFRNVPETTLKMASNRRWVRGTTLFELLFALSLISLLAAGSLPNIGEAIAQRHGLQALRKMSLAINLSRTAAIRGAVLVTLCRSSDLATCGGSWSDGFIAFTDRNGNRRVDGADEIFHVHRFEGLAGSLSWRAFRNRQYLQITRHGFTRYQNGNFTFCPQSDEMQYARQLIINRTARVRFSTDSDGDGLREDSRGRPIRCD